MKYFCAMPTSMEHTDIILAGAGLSGLTLALELAKRPFFSEKNILLLDRDEKNRNDRTWCFWAKENEPLPPVVHKTWGDCHFYGEKWAKRLQIAPYRYHMVRGADYYAWAKGELSRCPNVRWKKADILGFDAASGTVKSDVGEFRGEHVFNSAFFMADGGRVTVDGGRGMANGEWVSAGQRARTTLLQHFKGWEIEAPRAVFDPAVVTFMDYRLEQRGETRFVYVLPFDERRALVEFTVFSRRLCEEAEYRAELQRYITEVLGIPQFDILGEEFGVIPMTDLPLLPEGEGRVVNIGTAGGFVKASSGYAFLRTQRKTRAFVDDWERNRRPCPAVLRSPWLFRTLDSIMLRVLDQGAVSGKDFFTQLFQRLPARSVFRFLDEDASFADTLRVLAAPPTWPFLRVALGG
jgi:lycopene beta-cyclase